MSKWSHLSPAQFLACSVHVPEQMEVFLAACCIAALKRTDEAMCRFDFVVEVEDQPLTVPVLMPAYDERLMNLILDATVSGRMSATVRTVVVSGSGMQDRVVYALDDGRVVAQLFAGRGGTELVIEIGEPEIERESSGRVLWLSTVRNSVRGGEQTGHGHSVH